MEHLQHKKGFFENFARVVTRWTASSWAFGLACVVVLAWVVSGPLFDFSDTWQLVINTGTTVVTFLMVFLIQRAQNIDAYAIQLKLNELVAAMHGASNRLINIEDLSEAELEVLHRHYQRLVELAGHEHRLTNSHTVEEASRRHASKHGGKKST